MAGADDMPQPFDVIVIGGGIMGCSAAFQLAQRGLKVALLEKSSIGMGRVANRRPTFVSTIPTS
jgi:glycine/D-amino acid oxidase-like deaminating enzyme